MSIVLAVIIISVLVSTLLVMKASKRKDDDSVDAVEDDVPVDFDCECTKHLK